MKNYNIYINIELLSSELSLKGKGFDIKECHKFLNSIDNIETRDAVLSLLINTTYISNSKFKLKIQTNVNDFLNFRKIGRPIFAYLDTSDSKFYQKSNLWIYQLIQSSSKFQSANMRMIFVNSLDDDRIINDDIVLLADDCIYSGKQMADTMTIIKNNQKKSVNIFLYVPFISHEGFDRIKKAYERNENINTCTLHIMDKTEYIKPARSFLTQNQTKNLAYYYPHLSEAIISSAYPVYFEHRVAKFVSSFPSIYSGVIPNEHNREIIKNIADIDDKMQMLDFFKFVMQQGDTIPDYDNIDDLRNEIKQHKKNMKNLQKQIQVVPFLKMCVSVQPAMGDLYESSCPIPIYKSNTVLPISLTLERRSSSKSSSKSSSSS